MNTDPVISSRYGVRPLLDLPALDVASGSNYAPNPSDLATMAPPPLQGSDSQDQHRPWGPQGPGVPALAPHQPLPLDWPYAVKLPGSLFAAPPGPLPFKNPQIFPYSFLPSTLQPPSFPVTDASGQPVLPMDLSPERQNLSRLYPGVHDPCPPQGYFAPSAGLPLPGLVPQWPQQPQAAGPSQAADVERVHFEGVLTYGELSSVHGRDRSSTFWSLPEFLRNELHETYGHVPATDVRVVVRHGEFHVYASPRRPVGDTTDRRLVASDQRLITD